MGLSLPPFQPGPVVTSGGAPDPLTQLIAALSQGADLGVRGLEERGRNSRSSAENEIQKARLGLESKKFDWEIQKEKTAQQREKAMGELQKIYMQSMAEQGGMSPFAAQGQSQPPSPVPQGSAMPAVGQTPRGTASAWTPPNDGTPPMDHFIKFLSSVPGELTTDFLASNLESVTKAQEKYDLGLAFDEAEDAVSPLLTPQQKAAFKAGRSMMLSGAPKDVYEQFLPKAQIDLVDALEKVRTAKNQREADTNATPYLVFYGLAAPNEKGVIPGAAKILADYKAKLAQDAATAAKAAAKEQLDAAMKGVKGAAMSIYSVDPTMKAPEIFDALKQMPEYKALPSGVLQEAALMAKKNVQDIDAPRSETEARNRAVYATARSAIAIVDAMEAKGASLGVKARLAQSDSKETALAGAVALGGVGAKLGSVAGPTGTGLGAVGGAIIGGGVGAVLSPAARGVGRALMTADEKRHWSAVQRVVPAILRPQSGAAARPDEERRMIETYFALSTDNDQVKADKRVAREELNTVMANVSGLSPDVAQDILDRTLTRHEQQLNAAYPTRARLRLEDIPGTTVTTPPQRVAPGMVAPLPPFGRR